MTLLNLTTTDEKNAPNDYYGYVLQEVIKIIEEEIVKLGRITLINPEDKELLEQYKRLVNFKLSRSEIKKVIMTMPYNATKVSMVDYMVQEIKCKEHFILIDGN